MITTTTTSDLTHWVHTGIDAPYQFAIKDLAELETGRGVAYSAQLIHPELGAVGLIANEGCGGPTMFYAHDRTRFGDRDLEAFFADCQQDGEPMGSGFSGLETLLDAIISEADGETFIAEMRRDNEFHIRRFQPRTADNHSSYRGTPMAFNRPALRRADREHLAADLAEDPETRLDEGEIWQMFNGAEWVPLLSETSMTTEQTAARLQAAQELAGVEGNRAYTHGIVLPCVHLRVVRDVLPGRFWVLGDTNPRVNTFAWCRCPARQTTVRFELWTDNSPVESGTVHAATGCRGLVTID